ncbi:hypothetical protein BgiBS90_018566 [Biomphalaria glabrata]|nr:hypothetical protein BgiBS90_018566 [Biomphalaria glabrata]
MMGTSTGVKRDGRKFRKEVIIAWEFVSSSVRQDLVVKLNPEMPISGKDWRMLASKLGYNQSEIMFIESAKEPNTSFLFKLYGQKPNATLNAVYNCLEEMEREDCLEIIDDAYADIYRMATEKRYDGQSGMTEGPYSWTAPLHCPLHQSSMPMSPSQCTCYCSAQSYHPMPHLPAFFHQNQRAFASLPSPQQSPTDKYRHLTAQHSRPQHGSVSGALHNNISPFDNSNISGNYNSQDMMDSQTKMARQHSDECNEAQGCAGDESRLYQNISDRNGPFSPSNMNFRFPGPGQKSAEVKMQQMPQAGPPNSINLSRGRQLNTSVNYVNGQTFGMCPGQAANAGGGQSLACLKSMVDSHENYRPAAEYNHALDRSMETERKKRNDKEPFDTLASFSSSSSSGSSSGKSHPSSTFPFRIKTKTPVEDLSQLTISKKSTSMPQDMKPAEYRKAFRNTKVFVTYSFDNEIHGKQVLSLCKFLQTNGFACYVDVKESKEDNSVGNIIEWCSKKMSEIDKRLLWADFILVCVSPKYIQDIGDAGSRRNKNLPQVSERKLHTKEIFSLMENEHLKSNGNGAARQVQIVPLMFGGMQPTGLPTWMTANRPVYRWPDQYLDLAWLLTKPQERIKESRRCMD